MENVGGGSGKKQGSRTRPGREGGLEQWSCVCIKPFLLPPYWPVMKEPALSNRCQIAWLQRPRRPLCPQGAITVRSAVILRPLGRRCGCRSEPVYIWVMAALPICLFVHLPISLSIQSFILLFIICLSTCLFICPSLIHCACPSTHPFISPIIHRSLCPLSFPYFYFPSHSTKDLHWIAGTHTT